MAPENQVPSAEPVNELENVRVSTSVHSVEHIIDQHAATGPDIDTGSLQSSGQSSPAVFSSNDGLEIKDQSTAQTQVAVSPDRSQDVDAWTIDPENAMNWPLGKKIYHSAIVALSGLCM
jgi:hypothetical protein